MRMGRPVKVIGRLHGGPLPETRPGAQELEGLYFLYV